MALKQLNTDLFGEPLDALPTRVATAVELLSLQGSIESRGVVYTRPEVVDFILDLVGYTKDQPLHLKRILEPSFGGGDFLLAIIERLLAAWKASKRMTPITDDLVDAIRAV
ncbi:MAG: modification methylase PaeR7I, partial [Kiritimatiellae bacterium]|nr:modification methylase PaeR7I [Kiritimatiellia bacterium]